MTPLIDGWAATGWTTRTQVFTILPSKGLAADVYADRQTYVSGEPVVLTGGRDQCERQL